MTTREIVSIFHGKSVVRGKRWKALCPVHGDHHASLEIAVGRNGKTLLICRSHGCAVKDVLDAKGLKFSDLFADSIPDRKAIEAANKKRLMEESQKGRIRSKIGRDAAMQRYWSKRTCELAKALMEDPKNNRLNMLFLDAMRKSRSLDESVVNQMVKLGFKREYFQWGI